MKSSEMRGILRLFRSVRGALPAILALALSVSGVFGAEGTHAAAEVGPHGVDGATLALFWGVPFAGVLLSIALCPLFTPQFWHHHYGKLTAAWSAAMAVPFIAIYGHDGFHDLMHVMLLDYVPFLILLAALFTVAGGICLKGSLRGSPPVNLAILALGTVLASLMGTTGASMLLVRPLIRANQWRKSQVHVIIFFIFLVANIGGSLTPLGDPPLFLGFLKGVAFFWTLRLLPATACAAGLLLALFFIIDSALYKKEGAPPSDGAREPLRLEGKFNFLLVLGIIGAILLSSFLGDKDGFYDRAKAAEYGTRLQQAAGEQQAARDTLRAYIHANPNQGQLSASNAEVRELRRAHLDAISHANALRAEQEEASTRGVSVLGIKVPLVNLVRDGLLILILGLSLVCTQSSTRKDNFFTWGPIVEVARLFAGIFITIVPVIAILKSGIHGSMSPVIWAVLRPDNTANNAMYFWFSGTLSSFLDNAPTYLVFFNTAGGDASYLMSEGAATLMAVSAGSVFMGANSYIGNAPNFMVKSIAEENGIKMPSFFGYMAWSVGILIPLFIAITLIWFV